MSMRSEWQKIKIEAKTANGNKEVKFATTEDLGPLLDKFETAEKAFEKAKEGEHNAAWAKAAEAYIAAGSAALKAGTTYQQSLPHLAITEEAKHVIDTHLVMLVMRPLTEVAKEGRRIQPLVAKAKLVK